MKSYISILYAKTNSITDEKLSIGVIYFSDDKAILRVSEKKIDLVKYLTNAEVSSFLRSNIHLFENKINAINEKLKLDSSNKGILNKDYFEYLNKYSQGLILFEKLKPIYNGFGEEELEEVLSRFIGEDVNLTSFEENADVENINNLKKGTKYPQRNKKLTIRPEMISGILKTITLIGGYYKNNKIQLFKKINLSKKHYYVISDLYELKALQHSLSNKFNIAEANIDINLLVSSKIDDSTQKDNDFLLNDDYTVFYNGSDWREKIMSLEEDGYRDIRQKLILQ
ncbi:MAG: hypothetical protein R3E32_13350 [Chitinophagales bacterium]